MVDSVTPESEVKVKKEGQRELSLKGEHLACKVFRKGRGRRNREEGSMERKSMGGNNKPMETRDPVRGIILPPVVYTHQLVNSIDLAVLLAALLLVIPRFQTEITNQRTR